MKCKWSIQIFVILLYVGDQIQVYNRRKNDQRQIDTV